MEGLEVSIINKSDLERTLRFDSEFYSEENLVIQDILNKHKTAKISDLTYVSDGNHMSISDRFAEKGIPYYRGQDIHNFFIEQSNPICIDEEAYNLPTMKRSHLKKGDVLLSIVGTIGGVSLVSKEEPATCNCKLAILRPNHIDGFYLSVFLQSKFGQNQIKKFTRGAVQKGLILEDMDQIFVPVLSIDFQNEIHSLLDLAYKKLERSKKIYKHSEDVILDIIGLNSSELNKDSLNIKNLKESFLESGRLDAEYYQPKYDDYLQLIYNYSNGYKPLYEVCNIKDKNFKLVDKKQYNYIELSDIGKSGEVKSCTTDFGSELPTRARRKVSTNDVIISSIEGSLESCALISSEYDNALCSTGFYVINSEIINAETLLVLFKSELMQNILKQNCSGTILTSISKNEFINIPVPIIDEKTQEKIQSKITESFQLRTESEELLEAAKQAVELAIEQGETAATDFINNNYGDKF
ncbi:restriction endonuclease subunit S [Oceanobacillus profundus]|uniref:restriction endonuclease subunit S n=1 Tax=Oceanobacillus profundus TaxID=372463 RepID=UPI001314D012|nr:restriction endonuclease subunit S [Oceanobacillus profundus]